MATLTSPHYTHPAPATTKVGRVTTILHWTYALLPIAAGADKFLHLLTDWNKYLAPVVVENIPLSPNAFMSIVGAIEIFAGILVLVSPRIGSLIVALWLMGIVVNLVLTGQYFDIAVRDTVIAIGALCLFILSNEKKDT